MIHHLEIIDVWMLFSLAVPFMEIISQTAIAWINKNCNLDALNTSNEGQSKIINNYLGFFTTHLPVYVVVK